MIAVRLYERADWERRLRALGCVPAPELTKLKTAEWWRGPDGHPFTVPMEGPDQRCGERELGRLCALFGGDRDPPFDPHTH